MTTQSWSGVLDHTSDAGFRAWGSDFSAKLAAIGLVQTSDTGQINWTTVTRPGANTAGGYEIWRINDSLHTASPIFLKVEYGTGASAGAPNLWCTVGTGSNGSGTLTGSVTTRYATFSTAGTGNAATSYPSYFCAAEGFIGAVFRVGYTVSSVGLGFAVVRYSDDDGTPNGYGYTFHIYNGNAGVITTHTVQSVRTASPATVFTANTSGRFALWPSSVSGASVDEAGNLQVVPFWTMTTRFQQEFAMCSYLNSEISQGTTFTFRLKGSTDRTFIALGNGFGVGAFAPSDARCAMLWE